MRSKSAWCLLAALAACGGSNEGATTTTAGTPAQIDSLDATKEGAAPAAGGAAAPAKPKRRVVDTGTVAPPQSLVRETYGYSFTSASRDPFRSLTALGNDGPELPDVRLVSLLYNHSDVKLSLATFVDIGNKKRYTVHPGERIGRLVLASMDTLGATLRVNDFGSVREQTYLLRKEDGN